MRNWRVGLGVGNALGGIWLLDQGYAIGWPIVALGVIGIVLGLLLICIDDEQYVDRADLRRGKLARFRDDA